MQRQETTCQVLGIDSNHDEVTEPAHDYRNYFVYSRFEPAELVLCQGQSANRADVVEALQNDIVYITGVGHGTNITYTGDGNFPVFQVGDYQPEEADGKIVHFLSCQTAAELGSDFVRNGCRAYFGYDVDFTFVLNFANIFFECDSEIDLAFADGLTAEEVYDRVIALYNQRISELDSDGQYRVAATLEYDRDHLCAPSIDPMWGDRQAHLPSRQLS